MSVCKRQEAEVLYGLMNMNVFVCGGGERERVKEAESGEQEKLRNGRTGQSNCL